MHINEIISLAGWEKFPLGEYPRGKNSCHRITYTKQIKKVTINIFFKLNLFLVEGGQGEGKIQGLAMFKIWLGGTNTQTEIATYRLRQCRLAII